MFSLKKWRKKKKRQKSLRRLTNFGHKFFKDHFIPHKGNKHHPKFLRHKALVGYGASMIGLKVFILAVAIIFPSATIYSVAITPGNIISLTNQARAHAGLDALSENGLLAAAARAKASDMLKHQYFAHVSPTGSTPWGWIRGNGYDYQNAGENLAVHYTQAEDVHAGWMASPTHRANIVAEKYEEIGVGIAQGDFEGFDTTFVVQMFGTLKAPEPVAEPEPVVEIPSVKELEEESPQVNIVPIEEDVFEITAEIPEEVEEVSVQIGFEHIELEPEVAGKETNTPGNTKEDIQVWTATVEVDESISDDNGEPVSLLVSEETNTEEYDVGYIAPAAEPQELYVFNDPHKDMKLFGFIKLSGLGDNIRKIYLIAMITLGGALLLNIFVKIHVQKHKTNAYTALVLVLAAILFAI